MGRSSQRMLKGDYNDSRTWQNLCRNSASFNDSPAFNIVLRGDSSCSLSAWCFIIVCASTFIIRIIHGLSCFTSLSNIQSVMLIAIHCYSFVIFLLHVHCTRLNANLNVREWLQSTSCKIQLNPSLEMKCFTDTAKQYQKCNRIALLHRPIPRLKAAHSGALLFSLETSLFTSFQFQSHFEGSFKRGWDISKQFAVMWAWSLYADQLKRTQNASTLVVGKLFAF